jgi:crotonobetainyl-CoA:carnitine CoA-transferase CaiB-like acyl-CoA transferase
MLAFYHRQMTGEGQHVDISIQEAVAPIAPFHQYDIADYIRRRGWAYQPPNRGGTTPEVQFRIKRQWRCKNGYVNWFWWSGPEATRANPPFVKWMEDEGMADDFIKEFDWNTFDLNTVTQETLDRLVELPQKFFMTHTKEELYEEAVKRRIMLCPRATVQDVASNVQLAARGFLVEVEHPELGTTITYPGAYAHVTEAPPRIRHRAPLIGEHNQEIYEKELGISKEELLILKQAMVI